MSTPESQIKQDLLTLSKEERKIYDSVLSNFPATSHDSAYNVAVQGGTNFQFIPR